MLCQKLKSHYNIHETRLYVIKLRGKSLAAFYCPRDCQQALSSEDKYPFLKGGQRIKLLYLCCNNVCFMPTGPRWRAASLLAEY